MAKIVVSGVSPQVDGEYELPTEETLTFSDLRLIKKESGVRAGELGEAFEAGDADLIVALTLIALQREGKSFPAEVLWEATPGKIDVVVDEVTDGPPEAAPAPSESGSGHTESS